MPSPGEDYQSWSTTAANNGTIDPLINWQEGQQRASVNNSSRSELAAHAKNRNLLNGSIITTGTPNAQQFLSGLTYTTIPTGLIVKLKIGSGLTNTSSATLNMDGLGGTLVKTANGSDLLGGELAADGYTDLLYNGSNWIFLYSQQFIENQIHGGGGVIIGKQIFASPGATTYTPTPGMEACIIECIGGGGSGAGVSASTSWGPTTSWIGGGGGSGGYSRTYADAGAIGASQTVTVGAGGASGAGATGNTGGSTSVGALCLANGGLGGGYGAALVDGGTGGTVGAGDITSAGAPGIPGHLNLDGQSLAWAGAGGSSHMGGGAVAVPVTGPLAQNGNAASNYGSGGGGAVSHFAGAGATGGAGSGGIVIITEFAGRGLPGNDGAQGPIGPVGPSGPGTGDVLRAGIPTAGQYARWVDASHIMGVTLTSTPITAVGVTSITSSGIYTPPTNLAAALVECIGGGGGGGGVSSGGSGSVIGGGGGSGGYSRRTLSAATIGASQTVTIGAGGAGGLAGGATGSNGGTTSFGALCVALGGSGGGVGGAFTGPGAGGGPSTADISCTGAPGHAGIQGAVTCPCGGGGSSHFGGGAVPVVITGAQSTTGNAGSFWGGGGGGGVSHFVTPGAAGGNGFQGIVVITEFLS